MNQISRVSKPEIYRSDKKKTSRSITKTRRFVTVSRRD